MALSLVTAPSGADPIITATRLKDYLRIGDTASDTLLGELTTAATTACEAYCGRRFITQTWDLVLDDAIDNPGAWRATSDLGGVDSILGGGLIPVPQIGGVNYLARPIQIPNPPLVSVTGVYVTDDAGTETTVSAASYFVQTTSQPGRVVLLSGSSWPAHRAFAGFRIRFVCGYGAATAVPEAIKTAVRTTIATWFEHRDEAGMLPPIAKTLLDPYRILSLSATGWT